MLELHSSVDLHFQFGRVFPLISYIIRGFNFYVVFSCRLMVTSLESHEKVSWKMSTLHGLCLFIHFSRFLFFFPYFKIITLCKLEVGSLCLFSTFILKDCTVISPSNISNTWESFPSSFFSVLSCQVFQIKDISKTWFSDKQCTHFLVYISVSYGTSNKKSHYLSEIQI